MSIEIRMAGITGTEAECVVNAANTGLWMGGGVCGVLFRAAGVRELEAACDAIGGCPEGSAVITPGFALKAKYIIHAVGPRWNGGHSGEPEKLAGAYTASLALAQEHGCRSIAFPLISAGIFGYPKEEAWRVAIRSIRTYLAEHGDTMHVIFTVIDDDIYALGQRVLAEEESI